MSIKQSLIFIICILLFTSCNQKELPELSFKFKNAAVMTSGDMLIASTGKAERIWRLTDYGLTTVGFKNLSTGESHNTQKDIISADWEYYGLIDSTTKGQLINLAAKVSDDEKFTSSHIEVVAEFLYPTVECSVKYVIWVYPDSPGIRTQLFIKGEAEKHLKNAATKRSEDIQFKLISGINSNDYAAGQYAERYITTMAKDENSVQFHAKGLDPNKPYKLGFTWWNYSDETNIQSVRVTSVDGESEVKVVDAKKLPNFKNNKQLFETVVVDLPSKILLDGTCRIFFDKVEGKNAQVSELFIYENGNRNIEIANGLQERLEQLKTNAPEHFTLLGYHDCGEKIQGEKMMACGRVDFLPIEIKNTERTHIGYYNDTQHRNRPETPILKELTTSEAIVGIERENWTNMVRIDKNGSGILMVKESHKCANQYGVETGEFILREKGLENTGTSIFPNEITPDEYKWCWASWSIVYAGGNEESELALKIFDRTRYPIDPARDIYIQANTWGSGRNKEASKEDNVLLELETQKELGIDIQQIDDGWQKKDWMLRNDWYPQGWTNVVEKSKDTGVRLGLWAAAMPVTLDALKWHYDYGGFETYKLDFANLGSHKNMEALIGKVREFIKYTNHNVRVNWDLTENAPRFGYFWAREYGCIYLENRKPDKPENVVYIPHLVLRDIWHVAKYTNINKFQTSIQNVEMTNRKVSDAFLHNHPYAVAIGLVGTPLFFQETHNYSQAAREEIKTLLACYKKHRNAMYESYVFPIGDEPNNKNWTGFQWYKEGRNSGYLMVFRELKNPDTEHQLALPFLKNKSLKISNIVTGETSTQTTDDFGNIQLEIKEQADFLFLKYEVQN